MSKPKWRGLFSGGWKAYHDGYTFQVPVDTVENCLSYHRRRYDKSPLAAILPFARCNFAQVKHKFRTRILNMMAKFIYRRFKKNPRHFNPRVFCGILTVSKSWFAWRVILEEIWKAKWLDGPDWMKPPTDIVSWIYRLILKSMTPSVLSSRLS
jgi:hypothetical protein